MIAVSVHLDYAPVCRIGLLEVEEVAAGPSGEGLLREIEEFCRRRRQFFGGGEVAGVPGVVQARSLFRRLGVDPSEVRPCSEVFLRHILRGAAFPRICNLVDLNNTVSAEAAAPVCVYDLDKVQPPLEFRPGLEGESWESMRGNDVPVRGLPVMADSQGPFGGPFSDSRRTRITEATRRALVVWLFSVETPESALRADLLTLAERLARHGVGRPGHPWWLPE